MATATTDVEQQGETQAAQTQPTTGTEEVGSPISNEAYNIIAALHAKLEGLEAYRTYSKDADAELWHTLCEVETQAVCKLVEKLEGLVKDGKLRMKEPGTAKH